MFTSSTRVQSDGLRLYTASAPNASCMITGLLCQSGTIVRMCRLCASVTATMPISRMSTSGRTRVPANSLARRDVTSELRGRYEDAQTRPPQHPARSQGARWRGQLAVRHSEEETRRRTATSSRTGRVAPGCASSAEAPRRRGPGAIARCGWGNPTHAAEPCEPPAS